MASTASRRVLIADNNRLQGELLGDFYRNLGFEVSVAADGMEALEMLRARLPDLLILDLIMPRLDGAKLCSFLRSQREYEGIPVIIMSGIVADDIEELKSIEADAFIAKLPLDQIGDTLRQVTEKLVGGRADSEPMVKGFEGMYPREVVLELLQDRRMSEGILDSLSEGIAELSRDRRVVTANRAFGDLAGGPSSLLIARRIEEIFPQSEPVLMSLFSELDGGGMRAGSAILRDGERELQAKLHRFAPPPEGQGRGARRGPLSTVAYSLLLEDITVKARSERERERLRGRLAQAEKMSALGLFAAGAAHELNNPLTSILGYAQLLLRSTPDAASAKDLEKITAGAIRCKAIVENLVLFARSDKPERSLCDINALLLEAVSLQRDRVREAGIEIAQSLAPDLPGTLASRDQILQAFGLILENAVRAVAGVSGPKRIELTSCLQRGRIMVQVEDTGPGIPDDALGKVFEPFFTTRQVGQGMGLGLSVAYGIVTAHSGRITATNRPEGGARIALELPVQREADPKEESAGERQRRILIVDDEPVVVDLLVDILGTDRNRIDTAGNGLEALRLIQSGKYDLVILDLRMPDMTGQQVYDELARNRPELLDKLLFVTADTVAPEVQEFLSRARNPYLAKPFSIEAVIDKVQMILTDRVGREH